MNGSLRRLYSIATEFGVDPRRLGRAIGALPAYVRDYVALRRQGRRAASHDFKFGLPQPCLSDRHDTSGIARGHYFHQDLLVASRIFRARPEVHVDVGSRVDGFVAHVASFREIIVIDIRDNPEKVHNIRFVRGNVMEPLPAPLLASCDSASCLHTLEHFGLGRYGDPIRWDGHAIGLGHLSSLLRRGGTLYISVPIGPQRIDYNAHRVFSVDYLVRLFAAAHIVRSFSFVDDEGQLYENVPLREADVRDNFGCYYGCGIFELEKC